MISANHDDDVKPPEHAAAARGTREALKKQKKTRPGGTVGHLLFFWHAAVDEKPVVCNSVRPMGDALSLGRMPHFTVADAGLVLHMDFGGEDTEDPTGRATLETPRITLRAVDVVEDLRQPGESLLATTATGLLHPGCADPEQGMLALGPLGCQPMCGNECAEYWRALLAEWVADPRVHDAVEPL